MKKFIEDQLKLIYPDSKVVFKETAVTITVEISHEVKVSADFYKKDDEAYILRRMIRAYEVERMKQVLTKSIIEDLG